MTWTEAVTRTRRSGACAAGILLGALLCPAAATAAPGPDGPPPAVPAPVSALFADLPAPETIDRIPAPDTTEGSPATDATGTIPASAAVDPAESPAPDPATNPATDPATNPAPDPAINPAPDPAADDPAAAAPPVVSVPPVSYVAVGIPVSVPVTVETSAGFHQVTFTVDGSGLTGIATLAPAEPRPGCRSEAAVIRCSVSTIAGGKAVLGRFVVRPLPRATVGAAGRLVVTLPGAEPAHTTVRVVPAVALAAAGPAATTYARRPGAEFTAPLRVRNAGATVLRGAVLVFPAGPYHRVAQRYDNCRYGVRTVRCHFAGELLPGTTYQLSEPLRIRVRPDYPAPGVIGPLVFAWHPSAEGARGHRGGELSLVPVAADGAATRAGVPRSRVTVRVTGTRTADLRALGGEFPGAVGAGVTAVVGVRNVGSVLLRGDRGAPAVVAVIPPPGTTVRAVPRGCRLADRDRRIYHCVPAGVTVFEPGDAITWRFRLHVDRADERSGWVGVRAAHEEPLLADNLAPLTVTTASGSGGGTAMASAGLPVTGPPVAVLTAIGLLFVAAGAALCRLSRAG
ncbi:MAG TPA: hypothetical protein VFH03_12360 [Actinoplanes sp.]|nr:hypothetical protein [Actinoplanes sp.]